MSTRALQAIKRHRFALPWLLVKKSLGNLVRIETLVLFRYQLGSGLATGPAPLPRGLQISRIDEPSDPVFRDLCARYPHKDFRERIGLSGRLCYVALCEDRVAGYGWVSSDSVYVDEIARAFPLSQGEVFIYDCYVDAAHRGRGIYPALLRAILGDLETRDGLGHAVIGAASVNHASLRGIRKAGFREWKRVHYLGWGNQHRWWGLDACDI